MQSVMPLLNLDEVEVVLCLLPPPCPSSARFPASNVLTSGSKCSWFSLLPSLEGEEGMEVKGRRPSEGGEYGMVDGLER